MTYQQFQFAFALFCILLVVSGIICWIVGRMVHFGGSTREALPPPSRDCQRSPVVGESRSGWRAQARVIPGDLQ